MENKAKKPKNIAEQVKMLVKESVEECGCYLWDVEFVKEGNERNLIIYIDKDGGVSLNDCEMVNDAVDSVIEKADLIDGSYYLEISSPGIERELKSPEHLEKFLNAECRAKLYAPENGVKEFIGTLSAFDRENDKITIMLENGESKTFDRKTIALLKTVGHF